MRASRRSMPTVSRSASARGEGPAAARSAASRPRANDSEDGGFRKTRETAVEVVADDEPPEYVPMSEWIDDFESRSRA